MYVFTNSGLKIAPKGIRFIHDNFGRKSGMAYVQFVSGEMVEDALQKDKQEIGSRLAKTNVTSRG
jgi:membrane carboxypeptidase/penicillin-binding protein